MSKTWGKGKGSRTDGEISKIKKMSHQNKELKQEISRLRKIISRIDSGWCPGCLARYEDPDHRHDLQEPASEIPAEQKRDRTCYKCNEGKLMIVRYYKINEEWYYRACDNCRNRTTGKKMTPDVED